MVPYDRAEALRAEYRARINRVIDHIDRHIGENLRLEDLARTANFSRFHFHRIFSALVGETLNAYIQRRRIELAAAAEISKSEFGEAWDALMRDWLPGSGYQPDDRMCYEVYLNDPNFHPQGKFIIEIHEPIRPL